MIKFTCLSLLVLCISVAFCKNCFSQNTLPDSALLPSALANAAKLYNASIGTQSPLYTGPEYDGYPPITKGNAFFADVNSFTNGTVNYDGITYTNVPMLYDIYTDKVVVLLYNHFSKYALLEERVQNFDISEHHFVHIVVDTTGAEKPEIRPGYYDELYNGKTEVLVKRAKKIEASLVDIDGLKSYFSATNSYYLKKENNYYNISGEGSLMDILKDRKKELQQYIKTNKIKFRKNPEGAMVKIVSYYDHLTN